MHLLSLSNINLLGKHVAVANEILIMTLNLFTAVNQSSSLLLIHFYCSTSIIYANLIIIQFKIE